MKENLINISEILGGRMDVSSYRDFFHFTSESYPLIKLSELVYINPSIKFEGLSLNDHISFVPMEIIDEKKGEIVQRRTKKISESKGFTKFAENDIIWAKITPCMQNGKSAIAKNLVNGFGCGSTEFFVIRPKDDRTLVEYLLILLRDKRVLSSAQNSFGGSAGHQRVSIDFLKNLEVPLLPIDIQQEIVLLINDAKKEKQNKEQKAQKLLDSIDGYLLKELGIELSKDIDDEKDFDVNISSLIGNRLDVRLYKGKSTRLKDSINNSPHEKLKLGDLIVDTISGDWGIESVNSKSTNNYIKSLVIRATEFDNKYNLDLDNSRVKYRYIDKRKIEKMNIQPNDLLIEKSGGSPDQPVGRIAILTNEILKDKNIAFSNFIQKISVDTSKISANYLFCFLKTMYNIKLTESMQSQTNGLRNLIMREYFNQIIVIPYLTDRKKSFKIQKKIADHITNLRDSAKELQEHALAEFEDTKKKIEQMIMK